MKSGIILIDVLIGTAIAALIGTILTSAWFQTNRFSLAIDESISLYTRATLLHHQLEHDITGAFAPMAFEIHTTPSDKEVEQNETKTTQADKKKKKEIEKIFYGINKDGKLDTLTFITNNPLQVYWGKTAGKPKARIARVVYKLEQDQEQKDSYNLYRQEGQELDFTAYKKDAPKSIRRYEFIRGIKDFTVEYIVQEIKAEDKEKTTEEQPVTYKTYKEWKEEDKEKNEKSDTQRPPIPNMVRVTGMLWNERYKKETSFMFDYPIIASQLQKPKKQPAPKQQAASAAKKNIFKK